VDDPTKSALEQALGEAHRLLAAGEYRAGFAAYEIRKKLGYSPPLPFREWQGEDLRGKTLVVWPELGLGDQIQCARYYPALAQMGARVVVVVTSHLVRLFKPLGVEIVQRKPGITIESVDFYTHPFSVPHWLGVTSAEQWNAPYLRGTPRATGARIGIMPATTSGHPTSEVKSLTDAAAARLLAQPGVVDLRQEATGAADLQGTADIIAGLAAVISVDTSVAHLAGAMGKPTSILLPYRHVDWRWGSSGETTAWYPSARLYRQDTADWDPVVDRVVGDIL